MVMLSIVNPRENVLPLPAHCKVCGSATKEEYLDFGVQENDYGAILICNECIHHVAIMFGYISKLHALELKNEVEKFYINNIDLTEKNRALKGAIDGMVRAGFDASALNFLELDLVHLDTLCSPEPRERESHLVTGETESDEPSNSEGSTDLPEFESSKPFTLF